MPAFNTIHNELRLRVPNKPYELYDDVIRWAVGQICVKTSLWRVVTTFVTEPDKSIYNLDLPSNSAIHSNLYIIQVVPSGTNRIIKRPVNGFKVYPNGGQSDYTKAFKTVGDNQIQIFPTPKEGGITLEVHTAIKPITGSTGVSENKFFDEYKSTVVYGALHRLYEDGEDYQKSDRNELKFKNGISSIHVDVLKGNANTPMKISAGW